MKPEKLDPCVAVWGNSPHWFGQFGITRRIGLDCSEKPEKLAPCVAVGEAISALHWCNVCQSVKPEKLAPCAAVDGKLAALVWTVRVELAALLGGRRTTRRTDW